MIEEAVYVGVDVAKSAFVYGADTIPPPEEGDITAAIVQIPREAENISQRYLDFSGEALKYEPQFII